MKWGIQKIISDRAGISEPYLSQILSGNKRPSWTVAKDLAKITKTKPELWLDGTPEEIRFALSDVDLGIHDSTLPYLSNM